VRLLVLTGICWLLLGGGLVCGQIIPGKLITAASPSSDLRFDCIAEDDSGFLWLAGDSGIFQFDGIRLVPSTWNSQFKGKGISLLKFIQSRCVVGTREGEVFSFRAGTASPPERWQCGTEKILSAEVLPDQSLVIGTNGSGIFHVKGAILKSYETDDGLSDPVVHALVHHDNVLFAATDAGLNMIRWSENDIQCDVLTTDDGLSDNLITSLCALPDHAVAAGAHNGSVCIVSSSGKVIAIAPVSEMLHTAVKNILYRDELIILTEDGSWWTSSVTSNGSTQHIGKDAQTGERPAIDALINREGLLISTLGTHQLRVQDPAITLYSHHDDQQLAGLHALVCDSLGRLWMTDGKAILLHSIEFASEYTLQRIPIKGLPDRAEIISLIIGPDNALWIGTFGHGLGRFDLSSLKTTWYTEKDGLINNNILDIEYFDNNLWLATLGGLGIVSWSPGLQFSAADSRLTGSNFIYNLHTSDQSLWIGTDGNGIVRFDGVAFHAVSSSLDTDRHITQLVTDKQGTLWYNGTSEGLVAVKDHQKKPVRLVRGGELAETIAICASSEAGVFVITEKGLAYLRDAESGTLWLTEDEQAENANQNIAYTDDAGNVWIATQNGLLRIRDHSMAATTSPSTRLAGLKVMLENTDPEGHTFRHSQSHFTFQLAGLWLRDPEAIRFQYKLEGFDLDWNVTSDNELIFSQLKPGSYTLRVRSFVGEPSEGADELSYSFTIQNPIWKEAWFIGSVFMLTGLVVWLIVRLRISTVKKNEKIKRELLLSQFETLRTQVNPHFLFNAFNTLSALIEQAPKEAIGYVDHLSEFFRNLLQVRDKNLISLSEELEITRHYFSLQQKRFGENLQWQIDVPDQLLHTLIPPMTLQILAENAIKHNIVSGSKPLHILIQSKEDTIEVSNNLQPKSIPEKGTGLGLANIKSRYSMLCGQTPSIRKETGLFIVQLPVIPSAS
jgi:ligand-binding sensor domain-containing protein/uncharacterized membrane-anchored protein YhcB (DUF1043 family)